LENVLNFAVIICLTKQKTNMKKSVLLLAAAFGVSGAFAQDLTSKKGEPYLPEAGDWSIGINAAPFLQYAGNMLNGATATNAAPTFGWNNGAFNNVIQGKMFKDEKTAYRAGIRLGFGGSKESVEVAKQYVQGGAPTTVTFPTKADVVINEKKTSSKDIALSGGIEMRRGKTRLQGYYGGELGFGLSGSKSKYTYGNALVADNTTAGTTGIAVNTNDNFGDGNYMAVSSPVSQGQDDDARPTEVKNGSTITFGLRGFIGAEYFIFPKMSIGGEFGWGLALSKTGASKKTYETRGTSSAVGSNQTVGTIELEGQKSGNWSFDTQNINNVFGPAAQLRLNLHF